MPPDETEGIKIADDHAGKLISWLLDRGITRRECYEGIKKNLDILENIMKEKNE